MAQAQTQVRRRSCMAVPGGDPRKLDKAPSAGADELVLDLEDAVPAAGKDAARALVAGRLSGEVDLPGAVAVRVNAPRSPWSHLDIVACAEAGGLPRSIVVPKVEGAGDIAYVERLLDGAEARSGRAEPVTIQALIESAAGLANLREISGASPRLRALILGYADLSASLGRVGRLPAEAWYPAQDALLVAARTAGLQAIDGPHLGVAVDDEFLAAVDRARALGFDGKWVIHPSQVDEVTRAFTPSDQEIGHARAVLAALRDAERAGRGAVALDGQMLDEAVAVAARRTLTSAGASA